MKNLYPMLLCDFYKISHREQYELGTEKVYSTWTPRMSRLEGVSEVVVFGFQAFIKEYLIEFFNENFFKVDKNKILDDYSRIVKNTLGVENPNTSHIEALHDLRYLPLKIKALPEGSLCPIKVPMLTIENTINEFFWLPTYFETLMSCELWLPTNSATIAYQYRKLLNKYAIETTGSTDGVNFQGHDFSMRGMGGLRSSVLSGMGHLLSFNGTDTIPAIMAMEEYYNANVESELVGTSIPATEHSVMCASGKDNELNTYTRLITEVYPSGYLAIVSDTWDLWNTITNILPKLKNEILNRNGKVVIRPDSGDPVDIICGNVNFEPSPKQKGVIELLWEIFGGSINEQGYKVLDSHIGCIYGDAITIERCKNICERLKKKGFASTNIVFGIGSYTYQYNTRDTLGFALKATHVVNNGNEFNIFKNPITDNGFKKSQTGRVAVIEDKNSNKFCVDGLNVKQCEDYPSNLLVTIFEDGKLLINDSLSNIKSRLYKNTSSCTEDVNHSV